MGWKGEIRGLVKGSLLEAAELWGGEQRSGDHAVRLPLPVSCSFQKLQAVAAAVSTFLRHPWAPDCVRSSLVSVSLAEMTFHSLTNAGASTCGFSIVVDVFFSVSPLL